MPTLINLLALAILTSTVAVNAQASSTIQTQIRSFARQAGAPANPEAGRQLWYQTTAGRSCTACHGKSSLQTGKHVKTGRAILPMAASANLGRYTKPGKVNKWFLRNCKWTLGRECSAQEKSDILSWLASQ